MDHYYFPGAIQRNPVGATTADDDPQLRQQQAFLSQFSSRLQQQHQQELQYPGEVEEHSFFAHNPVFASPSAPTVALSNQVSHFPSNYINNNINNSSNHHHRNNLGHNFSTSLHSTRSDNSSYYSTHQYPPSVAAGHSQYPPVLLGNLGNNNSNHSSSSTAGPYHHLNFATTAVASHPDSTHSNTSPRRNYRRKVTNNNNVNNNKRSSFTRQDSGISDLDCSDHSGISLHSGVSSVSCSVGYNSRSSQQEQQQQQSSTQNNRRGMYYRQDSEHSFCSSSASSVCTNSTYSSDAASATSSNNNSSNKFMHNYKKPVMPPKSQYIAMDCEMVGTLTGHSACARVVLIDWKGRTVLDEYVNPLETITDYRTFVSGITQDQLQEALTLPEVRPRVQAAVAGKILIGHGLHNDLECLGVEHPWHLIRDTALYEPFMKMHYGQLNPRKLKDLAEERLNRHIQIPGQAHSPAEDALAALDLYKSHRPRWEACMTAQIKEGQRLLIEQQKQREQYDQYFAGLPIVAFP